MIKGRAGVQIRHHAGVLKGLMDAFNFVKKNDVLVGVTEENSARRSDGISNAQLMYIHTHGSPVNGIPPRPTIIPAITRPENRDVLQNLLKTSIVSAFAGNLSGGTSAQKRAGQMAVNMIKQEFGSANLAPNKAGTIKAKGSSAPLIDTGQLRNSITFVIRKK